MFEIFIEGQWKLGSRRSCGDHSDSPEEDGRLRPQDWTDTLSMALGTQKKKKKKNIEENVSLFNNKNEGLSSVCTAVPQAVEPRVARI